MQEPEARTGVSQRAPKLADAAVSGRTVGPHVVLSLGTVSSPSKVIFSPADRGMTASAWSILSAARNVEFGERATKAGPPVRKIRPIQGKS